MTLLPEKALEDPNSSIYIIYSYFIPLLCLCVCVYFLIPQKKYRSPLIIYFIISIIHLHPSEWWIISQSHQEKYKYELCITTKSIRGLNCSQMPTFLGLKLFAYSHSRRSCAQEFYDLIILLSQPDWNTRTLSLEASMLPRNLQDRRPKNLHTRIY